jgi:hypothetical protein
MEVINEYIKDLVDSLDDDDVKFKKVDFKHGKYQIFLEYNNKSLPAYAYLNLTPTYVAKYTIHLRTYLDNFNVVVLK